MKNLLLITALTSLICFTGCQSTVNTVENKNKTMKVEEVDTSRISTDSFLRRRLQFTRVNKVEKADGLLMVQVSAKNTRSGFFDQLSTWFMGDYPYQIEYRFSWFNKDGMEVQTATNTWIPKSIIPGDTVHFKAVAPNPSCKDFQLSIKENVNARSR
jgi:uncharacterized protein YcfL